MSIRFSLTDINIGMQGIEFIQPASSFTPVSVSELVTSFGFAASFTPLFREFVVSFGFVEDWDADALDYIGRVQDEDGQVLELSVRIAINDFVVGCKTDGIWDAIKASCIMAGARTLTGALVPLKGTAPTNYNFVTGDYDRATGLVGNGSTRYLDSNRNNNADPQDSNHQAVWISTAPSSGGARIYIGAGVVDSGTTHMVLGSTNLFSTRNRNAARSSEISTAVVGFAGHSRATSSLYTNRANATNYSQSVTSQVPYAGNVFVFATNPASLPSSARLAFYSIGESLDLALLDARVSTLITAIGAI